jgi:hypothetical protein
MASERDAARIHQESTRHRRLGVLTSVWAEFMDPVVIEHREPLPRELARQIGLWRRIWTYRLRRRNQAAERARAPSIYDGADPPGGVTYGFAYLFMMVFGLILLVAFLRSQGYSWSDVLHWFQGG